MKALCVLKYYAKYFILQKKLPNLSKEEMESGVEDVGLDKVSEEDRADSAKLQPKLF